MVEPELLTYVEVIERRLTVLRGREHVLSPRDFDLVRRWQRAGVPVATIVAVLEEAGAGGETGISLAYLARRIEARHKARPL
jgi:hypothetical protein